MVLVLRERNRTLNLVKLNQIWILFTIDLTPNKILFSAKSIGIVQLQSKFSIIYQDSESINPCVNIEYNCMFTHKRVFTTFAFYVTTIALFVCTNNYFYSFLASEITINFFFIFLSVHCIFPSIFGAHYYN